MTQEIANAMPDPNSNVQLSENSGLQLLGGAVQSQFTYGKPEDFAASIEAARAEQEAICGYALQVKSTRQTHMQDVHGRDIYEVFATFEPIPAGPVTTGGDGTR